MQAILECCCGVDVHKDMIEACIIQGIENPVFLRQQFSTIPSELQEFVQWLYENDCYHIAMESTGVYWKPIYETIEEFSPYYESIVVANAHHMRNLPGRKTDVKDAGETQGTKHRGRFCVFQNLSIDKRDKYLKLLRKTGLSIRQVSRLTGVSFNVVRKF